VTYKRFYTVTLFFIVAVLSYLTYQIIRPFFAPIGWAVVFSIVFYPLYAYMLRYVRVKALSSLLTVMIIIAAIIVPFSYFIFLLVGELRHLAEYLDKGQLYTMKEVLQHPSLTDFMTWLTGIFGTTEAELDQAIIEYLSRLGRGLISNLTQGVGNIISIAVTFVFVIFSVFFMFKDGPEFVAKLRDYLPFSDDEKALLTGQVRDIVISTIYGGVVVGIIQGLVGGIAYWLLDIPSPVLWGFATAIASFVPLVGSMAVWGPSVIYLFAHGFVAKAIIMIFVGALGISMVDNVLRPIIIGSRTKMHVLVILFSVIGGIQFFGLIGLVMGPLVVAVFVSVIKIFRNIELSKDLSDE
jgi:predicted PurR-regulated permease PerM